MLRTFTLKSDTHLSYLYTFLGMNWQAKADQGKPLVVQVTEYKAKRSLEQNRRYWAILNELADQAYVDGKLFSADAWHEHFKRTFIGCDELPDGSLVGMSSTSLSVAEFADYMTKVEAYAAQTLGITVEE